MTRAPSLDPVRRRGFTILPLRCLHCDRKLPPSAMQLLLTPIRCERCGLVQISLSMLHLGLVYLVESDAAEIAGLARRGAGAAEILREVGVLRDEERGPMVAGGALDCP